MNNKKIIIAKITSAHGIKGLVKLVSFASKPSDVVKYSGKIFDAKNRFYKIKIISAVNNNLFIAAIDGITDRNGAELLRNTELFIDKNHLPKAKKNEFYHVDLVNLDVRNLQNKEIGKVVAVDDYGAGGVVEIIFNDNRIENFSFTHRIFPEVNIEKGYLIIDIPEVIEAKDDK